MCLFLVCLFMPVLTLGQYTQELCKPYLYKVYDFYRIHSNFHLHSYTFNDLDLNSFYISSLYL